MAPFAGSQQKGEIVTTMALVAATALAAFPGAPAVVQDDACRADLRGDVLQTTIEFDDGSRLIGPWRVARDVAEAPSHRMTAVLDRVIEVNGRGELRTTPFPHGVAVMFEGRSERDMIDNAAQVWCSTVRRARRAQAAESMRPLVPVRITAAAASSTAVG